MTLTFPASDLSFTTLEVPGFTSTPSTSHLSLEDVQILVILHIALTETLPRPSRAPADIPNLKIIHPATFAATWLQRCRDTEREV
jgi:hypothetical protein